MKPSVGRMVRHAKPWAWLSCYGLLYALTVGSTLRTVHSWSVVVAMVYDSLGCMHACGSFGTLCLLSGHYRMVV